MKLSMIAPLSWGRENMLRTITLGSCVYVQGVYVKDLADGRIIVKVDETVYSGTPVIRKN
jgi:hypothetical protein